ncbi:unnamed protein product [Trichogramma brassicae]|uniref:HTH psq-type domain-containing protein n=1 Tax=Trichogramma brassicae TaxID=86971 RepID=A0A6H5IQL4_9HYME|nr:unnamed protein product [Trichogramma brassicae]
MAPVNESIEIIHMDDHEVDAGSDGSGGGGDNNDPERIYQENLQLLAALWDRVADRDQLKYEFLRTLRKRTNWRMIEERRKFLLQIDPFVEYWRDEPPANFHAIFEPHDIEKKKRGFWAAGRTNFFSLDINIKKYKYYTRAPGRVIKSAKMRMLFVPFADDTGRMDRAIIFHDTYFVLVGIMFHYILQRFLALQRVRIRCVVTAAGLCADTSLTTRTLASLSGCWYCGFERLPRDARTKTRRSKITALHRTKFFSYYFRRRIKLFRKLRRRRMSRLRAITTCAPPPAPRYSRAATTAAAIAIRQACGWIVKVITACWARTLRLPRAVPRVTISESSRRSLPEDKLKAIECVLIHGQTKASVARTYKVPESTFRGWCKRAQIALKNKKKNLVGDESSVSSAKSISDNPLLSIQTSTNHDLYERLYSTKEKMNSNNQTNGSTITEEDIEIGVTLVHLLPFQDQVTEDLGEESFFRSIVAIYAVFIQTQFNLPRITFNSRWLKKLPKDVNYCLIKLCNGSVLFSRHFVFQAYQNIQAQIPGIAEIGIYFFLACLETKYIFSWHAWKQNILFPGISGT